MVGKIAEGNFFTKPFNLISDLGLLQECQYER
jgi:hypothetical protein